MFFSRTVASYLATGFVRIIFYVCRGTTWRKNLSYKKWLNKVRTMLSIVHFTSVEMCFGKRFSYFRRRTFWRVDNSAFHVSREHSCGGFLKKKFLVVFELLSQEIWTVLSVLFSTASGERFWKGKNWKLMLIIENLAVTLWAGPIMFVFHKCWGTFYGITYRKKSEAVLLVF